MAEISLVPSIAISSTALNAENTRMEVIANNVANAQTTRGADGKVFRRKEVVFAAELERALDGQEKLGGVKLEQVIDDPRPPKRIYKPGHPDADKDGYVEMPNINTVEEMVDMMSASRAYEANLNAVKIARGMATQAMELMR
jgi:flagellar basal-body rod protein FlgC